MACKYEISFDDFIKSPPTRFLRKNGVYLIKNSINNKIYVGSAARLGTRPSEQGFFYRFRKHIRKLESNKHANSYLQNAFNKNGKENFKFIILSTCPKEYCLALEQWYIDNLNPDYNICKTVGSPYYKRNITFEERKRRGQAISKAKTGMKYKPSGYKKEYKRSKQGKIDNRNKRRLHPSITKLTPDFVRQLRIELLSDKVITISKKYNINYQTLNSIKTYRTWRDITI